MPLTIGMQFVNLIFNIVTSHITISYMNDLSISDEKRSEELQSKNIYFFISQPKYTLWVKVLKKSHLIVSIF